MSSTFITGDPYKNLDDEPSFQEATARKLAALAETFEEPFTWVLQGWDGSDRAQYNCSGREITDIIIKHRGVVKKIQLQDNPRQEIDFHSRVSWALDIVIGSNGVTKRYMLTALPFHPVGLQPLPPRHPEYFPFWQDDVEVAG